MLELSGGAYAEDVLTYWDGFGQFCRGTLGLEPLTVMRAWHLMESDPGEWVRASAVPLAHSTTRSIAAKCSWSLSLCWDSTRTR